MSGKWTRRGALGLIASGAGLYTIGSGGYTNITAEREADANVAADDSNAVVGISPTNTVSGYNGESVTLKEVTNNFDEQATVVDVSLEGDGPLTDLSVASPDLSPGQSTDVTATISATQYGSQTATLTIETTAGSQLVTAERAVPVEVLDPRLSYWDPDEANPPSFPDSWSGNDGSGDTDGTSPAVVSSQQGRGQIFDFRDANDVITINDNSAVDFTGQFTLSIWVYRPRNGGAAGSFGLGRLFSKWLDSNSGGYQFFLGTDFDGSDNNEIFIETSESGFEQTNVTVPSSQWVHLVWSHGETDRVYKDRSQLYETSLADPTSVTQPLRIGNGIADDGSLAFNFNGWIDDPKVYDIALSETQVSTLYESSEDGSGGSII
jgi:hypothetical protein